MPAKHESIDELLELAYDSDSQEEVERIAKKILKQNPNHPEALLLLSDTLDDLDEQLTLLNRAYEIAIKDFNEEISDCAVEDVLESESGMVLAGIMQRMIIPLSESGKTEEAFNLSKKLRELDPENQIQSHSIYYYMLLKKKDFSHVLEESFKDSVHSLAWAWSRFIAVFMLSGECSSSEKNFWEAIQMGPDVPFYMFGKYEEPDEDFEEDDEEYSLALLYSEHVVCNSEELIGYVMSRTSLFGLLSNRITKEDIDEYDAAIEILRSTGLMEKYQKLLDEIDDEVFTDQAIIKMISADLSC
jgi:tetratricopeptide (TPR) repeat protein